MKDTTVAYVVSYPDLLQNARVLITNYDALVSVYLIVALIYIAINWSLNNISKWYTKKTSVPVSSSKVDLSVEMSEI